MDMLREAFLLPAEQAVPAGLGDDFLGGPEAPEPLSGEAVFPKEASAR